MKEMGIKEYRRLLQSCTPIEVSTEDSELEKLVRKETGAIVLPSDMYGAKFMQELLTRSLPTKLDRDFVFMLNEMLDNAAEHGNRYDREKRVHLLWHHCDAGLEVYVVDQGQREFDVDKAGERREALGANMGCELSGWVLLRAEADSYDFYSIVEAGKKAGTLLKIVKKTSRSSKIIYSDYGIAISEEGKVSSYEGKNTDCDFLAHKLLGATEKINNGRPFPQETLYPRTLHRESRSWESGDMVVKVYDAQVLHNTLRSGKPLPEPYLVLNCLSYGVDGIIRELVETRFERNNGDYRVVMKPFSVIVAENRKKGVYITTPMREVAETPQILTHFFGDKITK